MNSDPTAIKNGKIKGWNKIKILGVIFIVLGLVVLAGGIAVFIYNQETDSEGYATSNVYHVNTSTYAFALYMNEYNISSTWGWLGQANIAQIKYIVKTADPSKELFIGYARVADSEQYLREFQSEMATYWHWTARPYHAEIILAATTISGVGAPMELPQTKTFWLASAHSSSTAEMTYLPLHDRYIWFIMNLDGSKNITADIQIAFKSPILTLVPFILIPIGITLDVGGIYLIRRKK